MRKLLLFVALLPLILLSCQPKSQSSPYAQSFDELQKNFFNPAAEFRTTPFWVWNGKMTKPIIDSMLVDYKDKGCGGVFVHPRPGLITEYLSNEWFELFRYSVEQGKKLGLQVWIYDENSFPSGFAGGHVPAQMPESYTEGTGLKELTMDTLKLPADSIVVIVLKKQNDAWLDITANKNTEVGKTGTFIVYTKVFDDRRSEWYGGFSYVDLIKPGVTEKFIDITMSGYEKTMGAEFGKTLPGIFTDEPNISPPGRGAIRWTGDLFERFQERWGYDLRPHLPSLFSETGNWKQVRHNYYQLLLQLFIDRWAKPWNAYTEAKNLKWTGHYWEHGWPHPNHGGDNMAMYPWHQVPAIDLLFNTWDQDEVPTQFGNVRNVKELASAANQSGAKRTLCETYGAAGWDLTFNDQKRLGDWAFVLGVNLMNQHLSFQTLTGERKYDFPQSFSYHTPWWNNYKPLNEYFGRLSYALTAGVQRNEILILEPTTTAWMYYAPGTQNTTTSDINLNFTNLVNSLEANQIEYDLGSENILKDRGSVKSNRLQVGEAGYTTVVLPAYAENIDSSTFELLNQFVLNGGNLIVIGNYPSTIDGVKSEKTQSWDGKVTVSKVSSTEALFDNNLLSNKIIRFNSIEAPDAKLFHMRRELSDGQLLFFVNSSPKHKAKASFNMNGSDVALFDATTGEVTRYPFTKTDDEVIIDINLETSGSLLLFVADKELKNMKPYAAQPEKGQALEADGALNITPDVPNQLAIDYVNLQLNGKAFTDLHFSDAALKAYQAHGFEKGNPWGSAVQYKTAIIDRDTFKAGTGFSVDYKFTVAEHFDTTALKLVVEQPHLWKARLNGNALNALPNTWWLDKEFGVYNISKFVKNGVNTLTLAVDPMSVFAEIQPVFLLGNFGVKPVSKGFELVKAPALLTTGSWKAQGMPFYSNKVSYTQRFNVQDTSAHYRVQLSEWKGTVAEVWVNGQKAGIIGWSPYVLDVTSMVKSGTNEIQVKVTGSLRNLLGPFHGNIIKGVVTPWSWRFQPAYPAGAAYQQLDYGLYEPFKLEKL